ncbi:hypothetical protein [Castellaniella sp. GW247-6E4]|uniref:hypothetical protein n=1 Tax=Castellaniella sp. GW247-6E4 TaxID=3140380 RepID=UPI003315798E
MPAPPADFPRRTMASGLGGAAPKFAARKLEDGSYSALVPDEEHQQAYENALDLAQQLVGYAQRKELENPDWTRAFNLQRIRDGIKEKVRSHAWDFTPDEQEWIMKRLIGLLEQPEGGSD